MGNRARIQPWWNTPCCDHAPIMVDPGRYVCPRCGVIWLDTAHVIHRVFGPGVEREFAVRDYFAPIDHDGLIDERWFDR